METKPASPFNIQFEALTDSLSEFNVPRMKHEPIPVEQLLLSDLRRFQAPFKLQPPLRVVSPNHLADPISACRLSDAKQIQSTPQSTPYTRFRTIEAKDIYVASGKDQETAKRMGIVQIMDFKVIFRLL